MKKRLLAVLLSGMLTVSTLSMPGATLIVQAEEMNSAVSDVTEMESSADVSNEAVEENSGSSDLQVIDEASELLTDNGEDDSDSGTQENPTALMEGVSENLAQEESSENPAASDETASEGSAQTIDSENMDEEENSPENDAITCQLSFDANGGAFANGETIKSIPVKTGETVQDLAEAPIMEGCEFTGWYYDQEATKEVGPEGIIPAGEMVLYAGWEECVVTEAKVEGNEISQIYYTYQIGTEDPVTVGETSVDDYSDDERTAEMTAAIGSEIGLSSYVRIGSGDSSVTGLLADYAGQYGLTETFSSSNTKIAKVDKKGHVQLCGQGSVVIGIVIYQKKNVLGRLELTVYSTSAENTEQLELIDDSVSVPLYKEKGGLIGLIRQSVNKGKILKIESFSDFALYLDKEGTKKADHFTLSNAEDVDGLETDTDASGAGYFYVSAADTEAKSGTYYLIVKTAADAQPSVFKLKVTVDKTLPKLTAKFRSATKTETNAFLTDYYQELYINVAGANIRNLTITQTGKGTGNIYTYSVDALSYGTQTAGAYFNYASDEFVFDSIFQQELNLAMNGGDASGKTVFNAESRKFRVSAELEGYTRPVEQIVTIPASYSVGTVRSKETTISIVKGQETIALTPILKYPGENLECDPTIPSDSSAGAASYVVYDTAAKKCLTYGTYKTGDSPSISVPTADITSSRTLALYVMEPNWNGFAKTSVKINVNTNKQYSFTDSVFNIATDRLETSGCLRDSNGVSYSAGDLVEGKIAEGKGICVYTNAQGVLTVEAVYGKNGAKTGKVTFKNVSVARTSGEPLTVNLTVNVINKKVSYRTFNSQITLRKGIETASSKENILYQQTGSRRAYSVSGVDITVTNSKTRKLVTTEQGAPEVSVVTSKSGCYALYVKNTASENTVAGTYKVSVTAYVLQTKEDGSTVKLSQSPVTYTLVVEETETKVTQQVSGKVDFTKCNILSAEKVVLKTPDTSAFIKDVTIDKKYGLSSYVFYGYDNVAANICTMYLWFDPDRTSTELHFGKNQVPAVLTMSDGTTKEITIVVTAANSKLTITDSAKQHTVSLSMSRITTSGSLKVAGNKAQIIDIAASPKNKTPFRVKYIGDSSYYIYSTYKTTLKKGTYTVPLVVRTTYDCADTAADGTYKYATTVNVKVVVR